MNKKTAGLAAGVAAAGLIGTALVPSFAPESDFARALGNLEKKWAGVYTSFISDGEIAIQPSEIALKSDIGDVDLSAYVKIDDARLTDARTPLTHAATHFTGGSDALTPADIGAMATAPFGEKLYLAVGDSWVEYTQPEEAEDGTFDHTQLVNRDAADQHPQSAITGLSDDLTEIRDEIAAKADASALNSYATTTALSSGLAVKANAIVGEIRLLPFRKAELPAGWYYPSGDYFALTSVVGIALNSLPANYKSDWGVTTSGSNIRLFDPAKFFSGNYGRFLRPVNGSSRNPGGTEDDAIRNISGQIVIHGAPIAEVGGAFNFIAAESTTPYYAGTGGSGRGRYAAIFSASNVVPTAEENRPYNVGLTPVVYLGE